MSALTGATRGGDADLLAWVRLSYSPGIGPLAVQRLLREFGPPQQVLARDARSLQRVLRPAVAAALLGAPPPALRELLARAPDWLAEPGHRLLHLGDPLYPRRLLQTADPPPLLWARGDVDLLHRSRLLAMVGTRHPSASGRRDARELAQALASCAITVVSGLARGIDTQAHRGALLASDGGSTVAVLGTGCDRVYPSEQIELAGEIRRRGLLLSEFALGASPLPHHFPQRNRVISGLCDGVLVTEAALHSGSLITARMAAEQGREVFAMPGSIHNPMARGCHALLRDGAGLVEGVEDILREMAWQAPRRPPARATPLPGAQARRVLDCLGAQDLGFDTLRQRCGLATDVLNEVLLELESLGLVARLAGGRLQAGGGE